MTHALFPGTFDPPTLGHLDVILRATELFDTVTVGLADHAEKTPLFTVGERLELLSEMVAEQIELGARIQAETGQMGEELYEATVAAQLAEAGL